MYAKQSVDLKFSFLRERSKDKSLLLFVERECMVFVHSKKKKKKKTAALANQKSSASSEKEQIMRIHAGFSRSFVFVLREIERDKSHNYKRRRKIKIYQSFLLSI